MNYQMHGTYQNVSAALKYGTLIVNTIMDLHY